jgi:LysR family cys regulon transcriptional activator
MTVKLQQLQSFCALADAGFSVSRAARSLGTSQPAVSKQIRNLESDLQLELLIRANNRIVGLTSAGQAIFEAARRTLWEADNLQRVTEEFCERGAGGLVIATTHMYARYVLRPVIKDFMRDHPEVRLVLRQGIPAAIAEWVASGDADVGISGKSDEPHDELAFFPCAELSRSVFAPVRHPVLREKKVTLRALAQYPLITLDPSLEGGSVVLGAFERAGVKVNVVLSAIDADVVKSYAELGLGIAVLPSVAYEPGRDRRLGIVDAAHLFAPTSPTIVLRRSRYLRSYMHEFIRRLAPQWDREAIAAAMRSSGAQPAGP